MDKAKQKLKQTLTDQETVEFLRNLAQGVENGSLEFNEARIPWNEVSKIEITFKNQGNQIEVKSKLKSEPPPDIEIDLDDSGPDKPGQEKKPRPSYKNLKKRMKRTFKIILVSLARDSLPTEEKMRIFVRDCRLMVGYSGYGDEYYPQFLQEVQDMEEAFNHENLHDLKQAVTRISQSMKDCHSRHK